VRAATAAAETSLVSRELAVAQNQLTTSTAPASEVRLDTSYDQVPYSVSAFPQTRPDLLATIATLFGMTPRDPDRCRVLELGCASGGNVIPMAIASPNSQFVGIDLSSRQINDGKTVVDALKLPNVDLRHLSITDLGEEWGQFDYILCHGVYSWVPSEVQEKILNICHRHLAPHGVAYVSYNCYPGWHARAAVREMLWYHAQRFANPQQKISSARGLLAFLLRCAPEGLGGFSALLRQEMALLQRTPDTYLMHEHLEEFNEPLYFHQFAQRAAAKDLQYLGEASVSLMMPSQFGALTEQLLREISPDLLHMEQYMDFLRNRMFRQTLLTNANIKLDHALRPQTIESMYVTANLTPTSPTTPDFTSREPQQFTTPAKQSLTTQDPIMKSAMSILAEAWPAPVRFNQLLAAAQEKSQSARTDDDAKNLATRLLNCYCSTLLDLSVTPAPFVSTVSEKPIASAYARYRGQIGTKVVNLKLEAVHLGEISRIILTKLDGQHDRAALVEIAKSLVQAKAPDKELPETIDTYARSYVDQVLNAFARHAMLVG
jgi:methyltransferase-like protein/SAM-dependent methyltransferase